MVQNIMHNSFHTVLVQPTTSIKVGKHVGCDPLHVSQRISNGFVYRIMMTFIGSVQTKQKYNLHLKSIKCNVHNGVFTLVLDAQINHLSEIKQK